MAEQRKGGHCRSCKKDVVLFRSAPNHVLHLILTILTAGLWAIPWIIISAVPKPWACSQCGSSNVQSGSRTGQPNALDSYLKRSADKERAKRRAANAQKSS